MDSLERATQLRIALLSLASSPKDTLFNGDSLNDVLCGRRVGVDTALVGREPSGGMKPDYAFSALVTIRDCIV